MTQIIHIQSALDLEKAALSAVQIMQDGGLVLYPTDTTYALGANALNATAVDRVFQLKGRDYTKPIHVIIRDIQAAGDFVMITDLARKLAEHFLPGALTLVLNQKPDTPIPSLLVAGGNTLGVRVPDHPVCRALSKIASFPITTTSANRSQMPNTYDVQSVKNQLWDDFEQIDLVLDAGSLDGGVSTVVAVDDEKVHLIRQGAIPFSSILEFTESAQREA
jgi:L-threonylcarbamoyladenylate synthase